VRLHALRRPSRWPKHYSFDRVFSQRAFSSYVRVSSSLCMHCPDTPLNHDSIILVHGLNGDPESTWQFGGSSIDDVLWPRGFLCQDFPDARILSFGYETPPFSESSGEALEKIVESLVQSISEKRSDPLSRSTPIIWIAHSFGGFLVKAVSKSCRYSILRVRRSRYL
jgi:hypothetical protein